MTKNVSTVPYQVFLSAQKVPSTSISLLVFLLEERIFAVQMFAFPHYPLQGLFSQMGNWKGIRHQKRKREWISLAFKLVSCSLKRLQSMFFLTVKGTNFSMSHPVSVTLMML